MGKKWYEETYINQTKKTLGYKPDSLNITVMNNANSVGKTALFGAWASLGLKEYNLSFEENGLLFIQHGKLNGELLPDKTNFIDNKEIDRILFKKGLLQNKLIIFNREGQKIIFTINKKFFGIPWHQISLQKIEEAYGEK